MPADPAPAEAGARPLVSIVIPALNAQAFLPGTIDSLSGGGLDAEVIVADGGSVDGTRRIAEAMGARVIGAPRGRGPQLAAGAQAAKGGWFLFLHADSRLQRGWQAIVRAFIADPANRFRAGYFQLILDDVAPAARRVENLANWRARHLGLPYGDQGLLISREFHDHLGGFAPLPLMEDVDLVRRIGGRRLVALPSAVTTAADRYRRDGWLWRPAKNLACLALYFAGLPPRLIARIYG